MVKRPRISRQKKVTIYPKINLEEPKETYKRPEKMCKIVLAHRRETIARETVRKIMHLICSPKGFNIRFGYQY